ncbi:MAG: hypothetical protein GW949_04570 [Spirochaetales bacterium]|nr:hypothetical protein [Spirochaetales bacterium]
MKFRVLLLVFLSASSTLWPNSNEEIAREYFNLGQYFYEAQELDSSLRFLNDSLEFFPNNSDALYLKAVILHEQGDIPRATDLLLQSLEAKTLKAYSYDQVRLLYISLLHRQKQYDEVIALFEEEFLPFGAFSRSHEAFLFLDSLVRTNRRNEYQEYFDQAIRQFPEDPRFRVLNDSTFRPPLLVTEEFLRLQAATRNSYLDAMKLFIYQLLPGETRLNWIQKYWQFGGSIDDMILAFYFEDLQGDEFRIETAYQDLFLLHQPRNLDALQSMFRVVESGPEKQALERYLENPPFQLVRDLNWDGYYEEYFTVVNGQIQSWYLDENQDGLNEIEIHFENSIPRQMYVLSRDKRIRVVFLEYPFVNLVERFTTDGHSDTIRFFLPLLDHSLELFDPMVSLGLTFPESPYSIVLDENFSTLLGAFLSIVPEVAHRIEWIEDGVPREVGFIGPQESRILIDRDGGRNQEITIFDYPSRNLVLEFYDPNEDGWYELVRARGINGIYLKDLHTQGQFIPFFGSDVPEDVSEDSIQLFQEYQNRLFHSVSTEEN